MEKALKLAQPDIDLLVVEQQLRDYEARKSLKTCLEKER